jgi:Domain of unknown function (DUF4129)
MNGDRLCAEVSRLRRGRPGWAVPVLLFLAVLLVAGLAFNLANLDTGGESFPGPTAGGTQPTAVGTFDPFLTDVVLLAFGGFIVAGLVLWLLHRPERARARPKPLSWWQVLSTFLGLAFVILLLFLWPRFVHALQSAQVAGPSGNPGTTNATGWPSAAGTPVGVFLAVTVLAAIVLLVALLRRGTGPPDLEEEPVDDPAARSSAADAVQDAIDELELGGDVRSAVLVCFRRFCLLLGARGITAQLTLTPRELDHLAVERLHVSRDASGTLTSLFEEARYSVHTLGEADRKRAIESLAGIRAALEA